MQGLHSPSLHTQRQLKEALYNQIINYFDQGKVSAVQGRCSSPPSPPCSEPPMVRVSLPYGRGWAGAALCQAGGSELGPDGSSLQSPSSQLPHPVRASALALGKCGEFWHPTGGWPGRGHRG